MVCISVSTRGPKAGTGHFNNFCYLLNFLLTDRLLCGDAVNPERRLNDGAPDGIVQAGVELWPLLASVHRQLMVES